jgi:hypothetical protein
MMNTFERRLEISDPERELMVELLQREQIEIPHSIHHTATTAMRRELERRLELTEALLNKLKPAALGAA